MALNQDDDLGEKGNILRGDEDKSQLVALNQYNTTKGTKDGLRYGGDEDNV